MEPPGPTRRAWLICRLVSQLLGRLCADPRIVGAQLGVEAMVVSASDLRAVTSALAMGPAVVIFELT